MKLRLPYYSSKDYQVLAMMILPITLIINSAVFGLRYFTEWKVFVLATLLSGIAFAFYFTLCGAIAVMMKRRFPDEEQTSTKLSLMIGSFIVMTGLFLLLLFRGYENLPFLDYSFNEHGFIWAYIGLGIANIFFTFLFEGIARYEAWKSSMHETEQLKKSYRQSQLQALKSQVNPHFLFNSLNSLSCLINEEGDDAEKFLDEMSKVYRYMLRTDEQLATLQTELKFLDSYLHLLTTRYGDGMQVYVNVDDEDKTKCVPPLTLQILIENAFTQNSISRSSPLVISITSEKEAIVVSNNIQPRVVTETVDHEGGLDNLVRKYELLNQPKVIITEGKAERSIRVPLIPREKEVAI
ncbi:MAG: histidine kinase [Chitinophagaceae bacterium]